MRFMNRISAAVAAATRAWSKGTVEPEVQYRYTVEPFTNYHKAFSIQEISLWEEEQANNASYQTSTQTTEYSTVKSYHSAITAMVTPRPRNGEIARSLLHRIVSINAAKTHIMLDGDVECLVARTLYFTNNTSAFRVMAVTGPCGLSNLVKGFIISVDPNDDLDKNSPVLLATLNGAIPLVDFGADITQPGGAMEVSHDEVKHAAHFTHKGEMRIRMRTDSNAYTYVITVPETKWSPSDEFVPAPFPPNQYPAAANEDSTPHSASAKDFEITVDVGPNPDLTIGPSQTQWCDNYIEPTLSGYYDAIPEGECVSRHTQDNYCGLGISLNVGAVGNKFGAWVRDSQGAGLVAPAECKPTERHPLKLLPPEARIEFVDGNVAKATSQYTYGYDIITVTVKKRFHKK